MDIITELICDPTTTIKLTIIVFVAMFWIILGIIYDKFKRPGGAEICYIISVVILIIGIIIDILDWWYF